MDSRLRARLMTLLDRPFEMASGAGHDAAVFHPRSGARVPTAEVIQRRHIRIVTTILIATKIMALGCRPW